jgi:hypothetical protein
VRKPIIALGLTAATGAVIAAWFLANLPATGLAAVSFIGGQDHPLYLAAGFEVTNCGPRALVLRRVQVQAAVNGAWKTLAEKQPEIPLVLEAAAMVHGLEWLVTDRRVSSVGRI